MEEGGGCKSTNTVVVACLLASAAIQLMKMMWEISSILTMMEQLPVYFLIFGPLAGPVALHPLQAGEFHGNKALGIQTGESTLQAATTFFVCSTTSGHCTGNMERRLSNQRNGHISEASGLSSGSRLILNIAAK